MQVTDKELLTMLDLCNIKLEYANLIKQSGRDVSKENHTIYSLLEAEINSFEEKTKIMEELKKRRRKENIEKIEDVSNNVSNVLGIVTTGGLSTIVSINNTEDNKNTKKSDL